MEELGGPPPPHPRRAQTPPLPSGWLAVRSDVRGRAGVGESLPLPMPSPTACCYPPACGSPCHYLRFPPPPPCSPAQRPPIE